ncbi:MAG: carbohydrate kinase family protein [Patescibacteria group bacterium]|jgi:hypothetical protein
MDEEIADRTEVVVAGHLCLDIIQEIRSGDLIQPGKLLQVGPPTMGELLSLIAKSLLAMEPGIVAIKCGTDGLYVRTGPKEQLSFIAPNLRDDWANREIIMPCLQAEVKGTTGAGDTTIAGFLAAITKGCRLIHAMKAACGTGAFCVEAEDATSNIPGWGTLTNRLASGWKVVATDPLNEPGQGWYWTSWDPKRTNEPQQWLVGPDDSKKGSSL